MLGKKNSQDQKAKTEAAKDWNIKSKLSEQQNNVGTEIKADRCSYGEGEGGHTGEANQVVKRGGKPDRVCRDRHR